MRNLPIDSSKIQLIATGKVLAKPAYVELADGSKRKDPNGRQATDQVSGLPVWTVDCIVADDDENRRVETVGVTVTAQSKPEVKQFQAVQFVDLVANAYVPRGSQFPAFSFRASGVSGSSGSSSGSGRSSKAAEAA